MESKIVFQPSNLPNHRNKKQALKAICAGLAILATQLNSTAEAVEPAKQHFNIPAQELQSALNQFSEASDMQMSYPATLSKGITTKGVSGDYTAEEALNKLLAGSGLVPIVTENNTVTIEKANNGSMLKEPNTPTLKAMTVTANANTGDDPTSYKITNSTTATKTDTPIMETPYSVKVVSQQVLQDQQVTRVDKAVQNVAGVIQQGASSLRSDRFTIRGFDSGSSAGLYRDGSLYPQTSATNYSAKRETANLEQVEVLKGPGSILFGRAEPGGVVNLVTKQPLSTPYYSVQQQFGNYDFYRTTADATGPLAKNNKLLYRLNLSYETANGIQTTATDRMFIAPVLKWNISPRTQFTTELEYQRFDDKMPSGIPPIFALQRPAPTSINQSFSEPNFNSMKGDRVLAGFNWSHSFNDQWKLSHRFYYNTINYDQNNALIQNPANINGNVVRNFISQTASSENYFTSVNLTGQVDTWALKHKLLFGGDYYRVDDNVNTPLFASQNFNIFNPVFGANINNLSPNPSMFRPTTSWYGIYTQDQVELPFNLFALAGGRFDQADSKDNVLGVATGNDHQISPRGGLLWRPIPEVSLYGSYTENFGASQGQSADGSLIPPQTAQQWEMGAKTELFDKRFSATLAYFDLKKQNIATVSPTNPLRSEVVGAAESRGVELDIAGELLPGWRTTGGYSYMPFARITKDVDSNGGIGRQGLDLPNAPAHSGSLWNTYEFQQTDLRGLKVGAGFVAVGQRQGNRVNKYQLPGYVDVNLLASYTKKIGAQRYTVQLNVDNLLDNTRYVSNGGNAVFFLPTRTVMGSVRIEF